MEDRYTAMSQFVSGENYEKNCQDYKVKKQCLSKIAGLLWRRDCSKVFIFQRGYTKMERSCQCCCLLQAVCNAGMVVYSL